jgi:hypothetical protein
MLNEGHLPGFRIGMKLWRTEQGFVDEYVREGQYARYRHELRRLRLRSAQRSVAKALAGPTQKIDGVSDREWAMVRSLIEPYSQTQHRRRGSPISGWPRIPSMEKSSADSRRRQIIKDP